MIFSRKHKFIYFKSTKVAGTSTEILLSDLVSETDIVTPITQGDSLTHRPRNHEGFVNHMTASCVKNKIGEDEFNFYFKFITVRNPYDRVVSWYFWQNTQIRLPLNFRDFVHSSHMDLLSPFGHWVLVDGKFIMDDYIRYENLKKDTQRILSKWFDVDDFVYPRAKTSQRKEKKHYSEYYDNETRQIVAQKYAKDIELFGYKFRE